MPFNKDEGPRSDTSMDVLGRLRPVMKDGSVTAGNASSQNDAASVCLVVAEDKLDELGLKPMGFLKGWAVTGCHPAYMGIGPVPAASKLMNKVGMSLGDLDFDGIYFDGMNCGASTRALASDVRADVALYAVRRSIAWRLAESCP